MANKKYKVKTVVDPRTGQRRYFYGKTEREAMQKVLLFTESIEKGRTFAEVADEWWGDTLERIEHQTQKGYKPAMQRALAHFGKVPVKDIKPRDILRFLNSLKNKFAAKTLATQRMIINLILDTAVLAGDIDVNPCTTVKVPKGERNIRKAASPEDEAKVKAAKDAWLFPFFALMSGMRKGEILATQWKDINFDEGFIEVTKSVEFIGNQPRIKAPKTDAGVRLVPLLDALRERLLMEKDRTAEHFIFSDTGGKTPLTFKRYEILYKHYQKEVGVTCTAHQLRHSFATVAFELGVPTKSVQGFLGHRQSSTTEDIYTHLRKKALLASAELLNKNMK